MEPWSNIPTQNQVSGTEIAGDLRLTPPSTPAQINPSLTRNLSVSTDPFTTAFRQPQQAAEQWHPGHRFGDSADRGGYVSHSSTGSRDVDTLVDERYMDRRRGVASPASLTYPGAPDTRYGSQLGFTSRPTPIWYTGQTFGSQDQRPIMPHSPTGFGSFSQAGQNVGQHHSQTSLHARVTSLSYAANPPLPVSYWTATTMSTTPQTPVDEKKSLHMGELYHSGLWPMAEYKLLTICQITRKGPLPRNSSSKAKSVAKFFLSVIHYAN